MFAFYGSKISEHLTKTPEGYIVASSVPIARTGWQKYLASEIGLEGSQILDVWRDPSDVFSEQTMASFEGKAVCDGHPPTSVTAENHSAFDRGHLQNVRRAVLEDGTEALVADLVVTDPTLIHKIETGLRELSCGYSCNYYEMTDRPGCYRQTDIRGNHVAVVPNGRAGSDIRIRDERPAALAGISAPAAKSHQKERTRKPMSKTQENSSLVGRMLRAFAATDAEPEEVAEAAKLASKSEERSEKATKDEEEKKPELKEAKGVVEHLSGVKDALEAHGKIMTDHAAAMKTMCDSMEQLHGALAGVEKPAEGEEVKDADLIPDPTIVPESDKPENPVADASLVTALRALRPSIAALKNKAATDNFNAAMLAAKGTTVGGPGTPGYAALLSAKKPKAVLDAERQERERLAAMQVTSGPESLESRASFFDGLKSHLGKNTVKEGVN